MLQELQLSTSFVVTSNIEQTIASAPAPASVCLRSLVTRRSVRKQAGQDSAVQHPQTNLQTNQLSYDKRHPQLLSPVFSWISTSALPHLRTPSSEEWLTNQAII
ncbi:hypothetical protein H4Q26_016685 [Puccinia striiformis f. sp. tritici PST-130]|nr:hypothetical protein H4Q26_016685 [Puccinia striiformis f. sp. tritici PST-130]